MIEYKNVAIAQVQVEKGSVTTLVADNRLALSQDIEKVGINQDEHN